MTVNVVIPARLASRRLPGKVLIEINGQPLIWHVWQRIQQMRTPKQVYVATDSEEVASAVFSWGGTAVMTSSDCRSGTERIASMLNQLNGQFILNVQGDEPLIDPRMLDDLVSEYDANHADIVTPVFRIDDYRELIDPSMVKVVRTSSGEALYFSRSPLPYVRDAEPSDWLKRSSFWGHIGVYGYRRKALAAYQNLSQSSLEIAEKLEQLRWLEHGYKIQTVETDYRSVGVDTPEDLARVRSLLANRE